MKIVICYNFDLERKTEKGSIYMQHKNVYQPRPNGKNAHQSITLPCVGHYTLICSTHYMSQKKQAPTNGVPSKKFCFKEGEYIHVI